MKKSLLKKTIVGISAILVTFNGFAAIQHANYGNLTVKTQKAAVTVYCDNKDSASPVPNGPFSFNVQAGEQKTESLINFWQTPSTHYTCSLYASDSKGQLLGNFIFNVDHDKHLIRVTGEGWQLDTSSVPKVNGEPLPSVVLYTTYHGSSVPSSH